MRAVAVAAVPDPLRGDEVLACIVPHEPVADAARSARDLVAWCLPVLAYYKAPGYVAFVDALPLTATNKIAARQHEGGRATCSPPACIDTRALKRAA